MQTTVNKIFFLIYKKNCSLLASHENASSNIYQFSVIGAPLEMEHLIFKLSSLLGTILEEICAAD
jgi:hypothetical protein